MDITDIIKEAFNQGWNRAHDCATKYDYEIDLKTCLSELESEVKKLNMHVVMPCISSEECECTNLIHVVDRD